MPLQKVASDIDLSVSESSGMWASEQIKKIIFFKNSFLLFKDFIHVYNVFWSSPLTNLFPPIPLLSLPLLFSPYLMCSPHPVNLLPPPVCSWVCNHLPDHGQPLGCTTEENPTRSWYAISNWWFHEPSTIHAGILAGFILCGSCALVSSCVQWPCHARHYFVVDRH